MSIQARILNPAGFALSLGLMTFVPGMPAGAQPNQLEVTSDTREYCLRLRDRVSSLVDGLPAPPPEVIRLSSEGQRMCDQGQIRGGILRLRHAWLMMTNPEEAPSR